MNGDIVVSYDDNVQFSSYSDFVVSDLGLEVRPEYIILVSVYWGIYVDDDDVVFLFDLDGYANDSSFNFKYSDEGVYFFEYKCYNSFAVASYFGVILDSFFFLFFV